MKGYVYAFALVAAFAFGQVPAGTPAQSGRVIGEVSAINAATRQITVKADAGGTVTVVPGEKTVYLRVPPGEKDLKRATPIPANEVAPGDRVLARGVMAADGQSLNALSVIVMTKSDLARKQEAERAEWQRRGVAGVISALNPQTREITITVGPRAAGRSVVIEPAGQTLFRRYAPDSVRFADAKPSTFAELKAGDQVRALGEKSADGTRIKAEEIVSGSFRNIAGVIKSVDAAANEIRVTDLETKKPLAVQINSDSMLRRLPPMVAAMLASRTQHPAAEPAGGGAASHRPVEGAKWQPGNSPRAGGDLQQMLERLPALSLAELKPGDAIIVASTNGADPSRVTAITLLAGVEPLLAAAAPGGSLLGGWNFEIGSP